MKRTIAALAVSTSTLALAAMGAPLASAAILAGSAPRPVDPAAVADSARAVAQAADPAGGPDNALVARSALKDSDGSLHTRFDRTYRGLPVLGGDLVVHQDAAGRGKGLSQSLRKALKVDIAPKLSADAADAAVTATLSAGVKVSGAPSLVVDATNGEPTLTWDVPIGGVNPDQLPVRSHVLIDARTGADRGRMDEIHTADGTGNTLYSGAVPLSTTLSGSSYQLKDATRGNTYTTDMNGGSDSFFCTAFGWGCSAGTLFTDADNIWGTGANSNRQSAGADAQYGSNMTWDYYKNVHGRNGIWNTGAGSFNRVHYGSGYVNAFWDGKKMTYGDGDGTTYGPLVSLDVAGHEMSHGVTENSAKLTYKNESGGLNEATSDIFGTMVEFYANNPNDPADYYIGEEFDLKNGKGFRRMDDPALDGKSASCWSTGTTNLDVHYSSGVGNHFFYLLAEGSGAKTIGGKAHNSPTCNGSTVTGIGRSAAERIWYRALTVYMTSNTTYAQARTATLNAAKDLYGAGSVEQNTVAAAWSAVNVN